jgi:hypothetical protein
MAPRWARRRERNVADQGVEDMTTVLRPAFIVAIGISVVLSLSSAAFCGWRAPSDAPAPWIEYAGKLKARAEAVLRADDEEAQFFRQRLEQIYAVAATTNSDPRESIAVNIWVDGVGQVERATLVAFPNADMEPNLRRLLSRVSVGPPPADMMQPVRLQLRLVAASPSEKLSPAKP